MINASKEFNQVVYGQENKIYVGKATIKLYDNTVLEVDSSEIWQGGIEITEQTSSSGNFDIGFCSCKQLVLKIKNTNNEFSSYDFYDAEIVPFVGLELSKTTEYIKKGVFTVDDPVSQGPYISLTCLDNMHKLDKKVTSLSGNTAGQIVLNVASACGVTLANVNFDGHNRQMTIPEDVTQYTYRQILSYVCQVIGAFAFFDADGNLEIKWYDTVAFEQADNLDGGIFDNDNPYSTGDSADGGDFTYLETEHYDGGTFAQTNRYHHIYSLYSANISTDDVIITGIRVTNDEDTYLYGEEGYILEIEDNPFSIGKEQEIAAHLGQKIIGMQFRPLNVTAQSNPLVEAGDPAYVSHKGNTYKCFITSSTFTVGQNSQLSCDAESYQGRRVQGLSGNTKAIIQARRVAKKEISSYDLAVQQLTSLMANSFGVFKSEETLEDGSVIYYMHDKPTLAESQTIWKMTANTFTVSTNGGQTWNAGIDSSGNAVVNVLNAIGINAEWVRAGKLMSTNGQSYIDLDNNKFVSDNVDFTGKITATSGKISGFDIQDNQLSVTFSKTYGPFDNNDLGRVQGFVLGTITPTNADYEKYDMVGKRSFSVVDVANVQRMVLGIDPNPQTVSYTLALQTKQSNALIQLSSSLASNSRTTIGAGGVTTHTGNYNRVETGLLYVGDRRIYVDEAGNVKSAPI